MSERFQILETEARSILTATSGFIAQAGFTHSLSPARNCTFACTYCYVPTMGVYGGLKPEDWKRWGQFTTFKANAAALLARELRPHQVIYCSPLVDPYQPAEEREQLMPRVLEALIARPPRVFTIQTRGTLILRDLPLIQALAARTRVRVSFSLTTNRDEIRRLYEPHCAPFEERLKTMAELRRAGIEVFATLAPLLPSDVEEMAAAAIAATDKDLVGDPLHVRETKRHGATTREAARRIADKHGHSAWFEPAFQAEIVRRIERVAQAANRRFAIGPEGFSWLAQTN
jgi:DNA repair photolyase